MKLATTAAILLSSLVTTATAQTMIRPPEPAETIDIVVHVDILPDHTAQARDEIASYLQAARREPGVLRVDALQEVRQNHFDIIETWRDEAAYRAHQASIATLQLQRTVGPWLGSPLDQRIGTPVR